MSSAPAPPTPAGRVERTAVALLTAAIILAYALKGGAYDVVVRGEAGVAIWWLLALGIATGVLPRSRPPAVAWVLLGALALLAVWTAAGFGWTESDERTSVELARVLHHLGVVALAVFALRRSSASAAVGGAAAAAGLVCALAVASRLWPGAFPDDVVRAAFGGNRLNYPLNYWNGVAAWGAMATAMTLALSVHARSVAWRILALAAVPVCVTAVYLTYSRAGVAGVTLGVLVVLAASRTRAVALLHVLAAAGGAALAIRAVRSAPEIAQATGTGGRGSVVAALAIAAALCAVVAAALHLLGADKRLRAPRRVAIAAFAAGAAVVAVVAILVLPPVLRDGLDEFRATDVRTTASQPADPAARLSTLSGSRYDLWRSARRAFEREPGHGTGPGTFEFWWNREAISPEHVRDAHSLYLEALAETGWPGLLAVLAFCLAALFALVRARLRARRRAEVGATVAVLAAFVVWLLHAGVDWMWEETAVTVLALLAAGTAAVRLGGGDRRLPLPLRAGLAILAVLALLAQLPPLVGSARIRASQRAAATGDLTAARAAATDAAAAWPWAASPYVQRALVSEARDDLAAAQVDAARARAREPTNWRHPLLQARLDAEQGRVPQALKDFRAARRLRPEARAFGSGR